jgi:hypothetical protein
MTTSSNCKLLVTLSVTRLLESQEIGVISCVIGVPSYVANVNVGGSNPLTRFTELTRFESLNLALVWGFLFDFRHFIL